MLFLVLLACMLHVLKCEQFSNQDCRYEFNVWQPDTDELQRMRMLEVQYANFTNYVDKELLQVQLQRANDIDIYRNWTIMYDKSLMDLKTEQLHKYVELQELRVKVGIYEMKLEEMKDNFQTSKYRSVNHKSGRKKHVRKDRMLPTYGSQADTPREQLVDSLKNMVSDLKAEWILLKREFIDMRGDNKNLHRIQNSLYNSSVVCHNEITQLRELSRLLEQTDRRIENDIESMQFNIKRMSQDLSAIKSAQESVKRDVQATENGLSALQASAVEMRRSIVALQTQDTGQKSSAQSARATVDDSIPAHVEKENNMKQKSDKIPKDCGDIADQGHTMSGLYRVQPAESMLFDYVYCEIIDGIGYTVIQRRADGLQDFNRGWLEYKIGFGNMYGDFWVGNDFLHALTKDNEYGLFIEVWDWEGNKTIAKYNVFTIGSEDSRYTLHVSGYQGDAGDSLSYHDGMKFSTVDHDNDLSDRNCAADNKGGWWFSGCYFSNLNGAYHIGWYSPTQSAFADGVVWYTLKDSDRYSIRKVEMKIRKQV